MPDKNKNAAIAAAAVLLSYSMLPTAAVRVNNYITNKIPAVKKSAGRKTICLSFDDGPDSRYTPELLDLLKENDISASFFAVAESAEKNPELIQRMKDEGHLVGLHSLNHRCPLFMGMRDTREEFMRAVDIMHQLDTDVIYFRPPWGTINLQLAGMMHKYGMKMVLWSVMAEDWRGDITAEEIARRLRRRVHSGSVICLHDGRGENAAPARTIQALRKVIPVWKSAGYEFVKADEVYGK
ncbi:MAG: polysaccharide deacetylase family protein [Eubacteriaceae bacterium]|jgi:peptidoglycan/xylan/chitin deacetylase (PgdA/CDA1 family)|nr:polysaccharide deacetylase family protein [Eubacteriaceae bacterium]